MTNLIHKTGNIFHTDALGIGQGVNTQGAMGAGIAKQFKELLPSMYQSYREACKIGDLLPGGVHIWESAMPGRFVYNIASQDLPGPNARMEWLESGVKAALKHAEDAKLEKIALPRIGSGIGGLDEREVQTLLERLASESEVDIELWTYPFSD